MPVAKVGPWILTSGGGQDLNEPTCPRAQVWIRVRSNVGRSSIGPGPLPAHSGLYIYNEPTNHPDTESIDALADALVEFSGGVVVVSHNSRLTFYILKLPICGTICKLASPGEASKLRRSV
ncbi:ATP-binding cassette transporter [Tanacetum coccineum]